MVDYPAGRQRYITGDLGKALRPRVVALEHLCIMYREQMLLRDISLQIYEGESVALLGAAGTGKSVFLACLQLSYPRSETAPQSDPDPAQPYGLYLYHPQRANEDLVETPSSPMSSLTRQRIGVMPTDLDQAARTTVADYLRRFAAAHSVRLNPAQIARHARRYGLVPDETVARLQPLQRRLLQLALALAHDPALLLLDEPLTGLGEVEQGIIASYLRSIQNEGRTLIVTFTPPIAAEYLGEYDMILRLVEGHMVEQ